MKRFVKTGFVLLVLLATACNRWQISHQVIMPAEGWNKFDNKVLTVNLPKTTDYVTVDFDFILNHQFPENEFSFQIIIDDLNGDERHQNFSFEVRNREGNFTGEAVGDSLVYHRVLFPRKYFNKAGKYRITMVNLMPKLNTPGILSFTVSIHP